MDKAKAEAISKDIEQALKAVAEKHGCSVEVRGGKFGQTDFTPKISFAEIGDEGVAETPERIALKKIRPDMVDRDVSLHIKGKAHPGRIVGYRTRAPKRPYLVQCGKKTYICNEDTIRVSLV